MRAPLVPGVAMLAAGIAVGAQRSVPPGDGPLLIAVAVVGVLMAVAGTREGGRQSPPRSRAGGKGAGERRAGSPTGAAPGFGVWLLLLAAGALLGTAARARADRSCAALLPSDVLVSVAGSIISDAGDRLVLDARMAEVGGVRFPCVGDIPARFDGWGPGVPGPERVVARGRWWRPPGGGSGLRPAGLLILETLEPARPAARERTRRRAGLTQSLRRSARARVDRLFGNEAPLAASLLLAQRDGLDREVRERYARAGLSHLLAISGLHVALVAGMFLLLAGAARLGKGPGSAVAAVATVGYVAFLGAPHSATRAALQIVLVLGARAAQRPARTEALIAAAALVILGIDPGALFRPGFQMSFAGVGGILALRRPLLRRAARLADRVLPGAPPGRWLADGLATSVAATLGTAPIVAWHFGRVAPVGIVANLVAIPLLSVVVPTLALALVASLFWLPAGQYLAGAGGMLLHALDGTAGLAAGVPGGIVVVPGSEAVVLTAAVGLGYLATRRLGRVRGGLRGLAWSAVAAAVLLVAPLRLGSDHVEIHVIDVGQGDAIGIRSPGGRWLLVDAGIATDTYDAGARVVVPYLSRHGVRRLEGLVVTHPDADHMGGAGAVLAALRPRWVVDPGVPAAKGGYLDLLRVAAGHDVQWVAARRGTALEIDGMQVHVLHPPQATQTGDANDVSVVLRVVFGEFETLLTGDAPSGVELDLVRRYGRGLEVDVLKVGHHGSNTSTTPELLTASGAGLALISAGRGNRYGHPHRAVLQRLEAAGVTVGRTDRHGSIVVRGSRDGAIAVDTERGAVNGL